MKKRQKTLGGLFLKYIAVFCVSSLLLMVLEAAVFMAMVRASLILPASYAENWLSVNEEKLTQADRVEEEWMPGGCRYGIYSENGDWLYGNLEEEERNEGWQHYQTGNIYGQGGWYYRFFHRDNGEICLVKYQLITRYANEKLNQCLPTPEIMLPIVYFLLFAVNVYFLSRRFGNRLKKELLSLHEVTERIAGNDLDFQVKPSGVREINEVMFSLGKLKDALQQSLKRQWDMEQRRKEELSALAHDIKTPLTVIRGNGELLEEGCLSPEDKENVAFILENAREIDVYLQRMRQLLSGGEEMSEPLLMQGQDLAKKMAETAKRLCRGERLPLTVNIEKIDGRIFCVKEEILRAWENLISNGAEHTDRKRGLEIHIQMKEKETGTYLTAEVRDYGKGFTRKDLACADQEFYSGDISRHDRSHQGLGLSIAKRFMEKQGGLLEFKNAEDGPGAETSLWLFMEI